MSDSKTINDAQHLEMTWDNTEHVRHLEQGVWAMLPEAAEILKARIGKLDRQPPELTVTIVGDCPGLAESKGVVFQQAAPSESPEAKSLGLPRVKGAVAVVPIRGVIEKSRSYWGDVFVDDLDVAMRQLVANDQVGAIVLDVDSPGGSVYGVGELSETIRSYRSAKPIYALADGMMASAAYHIGSAASKVFSIPSGQTGSIGVWTMHVDVSKALDEMGLKITAVSAGKYKLEGNPWEPLDAEAKAALQHEVDGYYDAFVAGVAKGRGIRENTVRKGFGEGRVLSAGDAMDEGMIDGITTLPSLLGAIVPARKGSRTATAQAAIQIEELM